MLQSVVLGAMFFSSDAPPNAQPNIPAPKATLCGELSVIGFPVCPLKSEHPT